jgi:hypothetical protein
VLAWLDGGPEAAGVLIGLDRPVAAYLDPAMARWLAGGQVPAGLPTELRARCVEAWGQAGLIVTGGSAGREPGRAQAGVAGDAAELAEQLPWPVVAVGVAASCGFCDQLQADLDANAAFLAGAGFGVVLAGEAQTQRLGRVPARFTPRLAAVARTAASHGTPGGLVLRPGAAPLAVSGYDQVSAALIELSGPQWQAVTEPPTSCSVTVASAGRQMVFALAAGTQAVGVGIRERAVGGLAGFLAAHRAGPGYAPLVLLVDRPGSLFLVFRGGEMIARLRAADEVAAMIESMLAGYAAAAVRPEEKDVPVLCGALRRADNSEVLLFPRGWISDLVRRQTALKRAGWVICPDPYIPLAGPELRARLRPAPGPVREILLDPVPAARGRAIPAAQLRAQIVNWVKRPAAEGQVHALSALVASVPVRVTSCPELIGQLAVRAS